MTTMFSMKLFNMKPEEKQLLMDTAQKLEAMTLAFNQFQETVNKYNFPSQQIIDKDLVVRGNFSTISGGKIGLYGKTPIAQQSGISDPSGGATIDSQSRAAIQSILLVLRNIGITL